MREKQHLIFKKATQNDLPKIVEILADDELGKQRENFQTPLSTEYFNAFENINSDQNHELIVVEDENNEVIGTLQLSFIQYLTYQGGIRAQIEAVRIRKDQRGLGKAMFEWAIKFYENLGFKATHEGMKIHFK